MNLPRYSLSNKKVIYFFLAVLLIGGVISFNSLGKKEDAPFVIKQAVLTVSYPGASPREIEELVTEPIESEIQSMEGVYKVYSDSYFSLAKITVELDPATPSEKIPQKWDELRRKTLNVQSSLPSECSAIRVSDDFGDVFGIYYALVASEGFSAEELRHYSEGLKRDLTTIDGVQKVALYGIQRQVVNIYVEPSTLANLGITPQEITQIIASQNKMVSSGTKEVGVLNLTIDATGSYKTLDDIRSQIITPQIRLGDIATIELDYLRPASTLMRVDGKEAIGIGISTLPSYDVVKTGERVSKKLDELLTQIPIGLELTPLYLENEIAKEANYGFILSLVESLLIVIAVIMLVMGWRLGILIGSSLIFSIGGTMLLMLVLDTGLNRTSLAGFIIAMGMLVDNAIVVGDNAMQNIRRGVTLSEALVTGATSAQWSLLGATIIGVSSFLPLYLAPSATAEIVKPLFIVLALSLSLSWVLALTQTPLFGSFMLKEKLRRSDKAPFSSRFYIGFGVFLRGLIRWRWLTLSGVIVLLFLSLWVMDSSPKSFFPSMDKPYFRADCTLPDGYSIYETEARVSEFAGWISSQSEVRRVSMTVGSTPLRYYLASTSLGPKANVANLLVELYSSEKSAAVERRAALWAKENLPDIVVRSSLFKLSPAVEATIEVGFLGSNIDTLESLTREAERIMRDCSIVGDVRGSWGNRVPVITPRYSQIKGQRLGISRHNTSEAFLMTTSGIALSQFRKGDTQIPILLKDSRAENMNLANLASTPLLTPQGTITPLLQVLDTIETLWEHSTIRRYNRTRVMKAQCDPLIGANAEEAYTEVYNKITEQMSEKIPEGYSMKVFGEKENQDDSNNALAENVPLTFLIIFITLLLLFKNYSSPLVILLMLPLIFIGVVAGLAISGKTLDFFAILGLLGLIGMNIKNAVVLFDEITTSLRDSAVRPIDAVVRATASRIVPVVMASGTTILGMLPLLGDALFGGMAATIMGGLFFSTLLTILILPVAFCTVRGIKVAAIALLIILPLNVSGQEPTPLTLNECIELALENSESLKILNNNIATSEHSERATSRDFLPSLSAGAVSGYTVGEPTGVANSLRDFNYAASLSLTEYIYNGGATRSAYNVAKLSTSIASLNSQRATEEIIYTAKTQYFTLIASSAQLSALRQYVEIIEELYDIIKIRLEEGYTSQWDLLMIETRLSEAKLQLLSAEQVKMAALQNLNTTLGNLQTIFYLPSDTLSLPSELPDFVELSFALDNRADYLSSKQNTELYNENIKVTRSAYNPKLWVSIEGYYGTPIPNIPTVNSTLYGVAQLNFSATIFKFSQRREKVAAAKLSAQSAAYTTSELQQTIAGELYSAMSNLREDFAQCSLSHSSLTIANENLELSTHGYEEGALTLLDVLSAQLSWISAYTSYITSLYDYTISKFTYDLAVGLF